MRRSMKPEEIIKVYKADRSTSKIVQHQDVMNMSNASKMEKTDEGYLSGEAPVAKVGVMTYLMADNTILKEFVPPETLFDAASMASLKMKPVTDAHPSSKKVDSDNSWLNVGMTGENIQQDGDYLQANMLVTDGYVVNKIIDEGVQELSPGYEAELVFQSGTYDGEDYDAIQVSRKYNHLAVVDNARGGTDIRMKLDSLDVNPKNKYGYEITKIDSKQKPKKEYSMKYTVDGIQYEADAQVIKHIEKLEAKVDASEAAVKTKVDELESTKAERDTLKVKVDELEKRDIAKEVNDAVTERLSLERVAKTVLDKADGIDQLDNRALKLSLIETKFPELHKNINSDTSDVYINALLDAVNDSVKKEDSESNVDEQTVVTTPAQKADASKLDARTKMMLDNAEAWKPKN